MPPMTSSPVPATSATSLTLSKTTFASETRPVIA